LREEFTKGASQLYERAAGGLCMAQNLTPGRTANPNPWHRLPDNPPFVLPEDKEKVAAFNDMARQKGHPHLLNLDQIPMPFVGRQDAPVVLLGNIAGTGDEQPEDYQQRPAYAERMRNNLLHQNVDFQFFPLAPGPGTMPSHKQWWTDKLKHLLNSFGNGVEAESILAHSILAVEFFPYRSCSNRYAHDNLSLTSQEYSRILVYHAMKSQAVIVVRYGKDKWFRDVRGLEKYQHLLLLNGNIKTHISPSGFRDKDGYQKVVDKISASLVS
jgi:hypothetical protein